MNNSIPILSINLICNCISSGSILEKISKQAISYSESVEINLLSNCNHIKLIEKFNSCSFNKNMVLIRENSSISQLKNNAIKISNGLWICFINITDDISNNYIEQAIKFINEDVSLFGFHYLIKENESYSENKSISFRFKEERNKFNASSSNCIEISSDNFFIKKQLIIENEILFKEKISDKLSSLLFINECIIKAKDNLCMNLSSAVYYSNSRNNYILSPKNDTDFDLLNDLSNGILKINKNYWHYSSMKNALLFFLMHIFNAITTNEESLSFLDKENIKLNITNILSEFTPNEILKFNYGGCWFYQKVGWLNLFMGEAPDFQIHYISQDDLNFHITYYSPVYYEIKINEKSYPVETNIVKHLNSIFLYENKVKIPREHIENKIKINDIHFEKIRISYEGKQYDNNFEICKLKKSVTVSMQKKYKYYISTGFNCETSFVLQDLNILYSSIFAWADVRGTNALLKALNNPYLILSGTTKPYGKNMFFCEKTNIGFHGKTVFNDIKNIDGTLDTYKVEESLNELKSRLNHLYYKFRKAIKSNYSLIITKHFNDIFTEEYTAKESALLIFDTIKELYPDNKFHILLVTDDSNDEDISDSIFIRRISSFAPRNAANEANFVEWKKILTQFM